MKPTFLHLFLFACMLSFGQSTMAPLKAISQLKEGTLVVNLVAPNKKISLLLKQGKKEEAIKLQEKVDAEHKKLMAAFAAHYTFSNVLFVQSKNMSKIFDKDASVLFDTNSVSQTKIPKNLFFVELTESEKRSLNGFVVSDNMRDRLEKPFPYFVSHYKFLNLSTRSYADMVRELNKNFTQFYTYTE